MRISYPRSFLSLLLIGFSIVAAPLLFALFSNALAFERLAGLSEQAVHSAVKVTQASRSLLGVITSLERSARQYAVAGEATFLVSRPITQVTESIRGLGEGQFARPIRIEGPGDMVRLGAQLDWLRERLVTLEAQKTRFLQHISHELKTPLTALREGSDLLSSGVVGNLNAEQREIARILQENSIELRKLIAGLLNYSAVHAQASYLDAKIVQLRDVVRRVLNDRKLAIVAKGIRIELDTEDVAAYCDEGKIRVVLD